MSNVGLILEEKAADIGNFLVGRLLPFRQKRHVGPFVFIDHMGPTKLKDYENLDVGPHPHIGLSTLTYLFEGAVMHRDSLGTKLEIKPGAVNWMTAGKGVVHSERTPDYLRVTEKTMHGLQIWVALPKELEDIEPSFVHVSEDKLPTWSDENAQYRLIAGKFREHESAVPVYSPLYLIEIKAENDFNLSIGKDLYGESALYVLEGEIVDGGETYGTKQLLVAKDAKLCEFEMKAGTTVYIFGGDALPEERFIFWNFVSSSSEKIEKAKQDWINHKFPKVPEDDDYVPIPPAQINARPSGGEKKD
ncbi:pirin family protein [Algoriella sp.]|uniref:pirin family protein n=1 Tax=Algoriella sp. TaxID=1872434 RepID=UPI002FC602D4